MVKTMKLETIFFNGYPKKEKGINPKSLVIECLGFLFCLMAGIFLFVEEISLLSSFLFIILLIVEWDGFVHIINQYNYIKHPLPNIYDKEGNRI